MSVSRRIVGCAIALLLGLGLASYVLADRLTTTDGKVLEGTVIKQGDKYWVKTTDGETQTIPADQVKKIERGSSRRSGASGEGSSSGMTGSLAATQRRANAVDMPLEAVTIWQEFIDSKPSAEDLKVAQEELAKWKAMAEQGAAKVNGRWITGEEYKAMITKLRTLMKEVADLASHDETLKAADKLEELRRAYPNMPEVNFWLGYIEMKKHNWDKAINYFDQVLRLRPNLPEAMANIAVSWWFKGKYQDAIVQMHKAAKQGDNEQIAYDLVSMLNSAPPAFRRGSAGKAAEEDAHLLASKYRLTESSTQGKLYFVPMHEQSVERHAGEHGMASGTGFIINDDGLILTNRHVVKDGKTFMVMLGAGQEKAAEVVVIDNEQDLALIRVKNVGKLPIVQLAPNDNPADGAECTVIGYPLIDRLGGSPKISHGIVTSSMKSGGKATDLVSHTTDEVDVLIDAKVNPGNSGGPILDRYGNVMAIVCMKSISSSTEDSYGMGISAGRIRKFLAKNHITVTKGEKGATTLSAEDIAAKVEPATVLILVTH